MNLWLCFCLLLSVKLINFLNFEPLTVLSLSRHTCADKSLVNTADGLDALVSAYRCPCLYISLHTHHISSSFLKFLIEKLLSQDVLYYKRTLLHCAGQYMLSMSSHSISFIFNISAKYYKFALCLNMMKCRQFFHSESWMKTVGYTETHQ